MDATDDEFPPRRRTWAPRRGRPRGAPCAYGCAHRTKVTTDDVGGLVTAAIPCAHQGMRVSPREDGKLMNNDVVNPALGISRRDLLKRGAVVGGTLVWAAPVVQTISRSALAQTDGTPPPEEPPGGQEISYLAFVLHNAGSTRYKFEDTNGSCVLEEGGENKPCEHILTDAQKAEWDGAAPDDSTSRVTVDCSDDEVWTITPADGYGVLFAVVKSGADNPCSLFDNNGAAGGYPKGQAVQVFQQ